MIQIEEIEMPQKCITCPCFGFLNTTKEYIFCQLTTNYHLNKGGQSKIKDCPLREVKK